MKKPRSIRWKITLSYVALMVVALSTLAVWLGHRLQEHTVNTISAGLSQELQLAREYLLANSGEHVDSQEICDRVGRLVQARVTLISADGTVLADSHSDAARVENQLQCPEIQQALHAGQGRSVWFSHAPQASMLYAAIALPPSAPPVRVLRFAVRLPHGTSSTRDLYRRVVVGGLAIVLIGAILSFYLAGSIVAPITQITRAASEMARGDLRQRVDIRTSDEVGQLAAAFNSMASHVGGMLEDMERDASKDETILSRMADGIIVTNPKGEALLFNQSAEEIFGVGREEALGKTLAESTLHYDLSHLIAHTLSHETTNTAEIQLLQPRNRILDCYIAPIRTDPGAIRGTVVVLHDLTEIRKLEGNRKDFVANVSHELRTPVASIRAMVETLLMGAKDDPEASDRFLNTIHSESIRLSTLLNDLLTISTMDSGKREICKMTIGIRSEIERVVQKLQPQIRDKSLRVEIDAEQALDVLADADALQQMLVNLIDNAIKYTPAEGGITIAAFTAGTADSVTPQRAQPGICIQVRDTGIGIPSTDLPRVFERFYRVDKARSREMGGTGLGLSIVKHLVELHGGTVEVASEVGKGTIFTLTFPA